MTNEIIISHQLSIPLIPYLDLHTINAPYEADIKQALLDVVDSGWYLFGKQVSAFEEEWADYNGAKYCVACANGLDALRLVLRAWIEMGQLQPGDGVIIPANTYIASILAVSDNGLVPIPVEPDPESYLIDPKTIAQVLEDPASSPACSIAKGVRIRAILPVHLYGQRCEMEAIDEIASRYHLLVLQDSAQSHGVKTRGTCAWSFYPGKNLGALGDAGAVTTDDEALATTIRQIAFYGSVKKYVHRYKGLNSRMDELQAAVLRIKTRDLDRVNARRAEIAARFAQEINNPRLTLPKVKAEHVFHIYPILADNRDALQQYLLEKGIQAQIHYPIAPHKQDAYKEWNDLHFPITEKIAAQELSIPCNQSMTEEEVSSVIDALNSWH